MITGGTRSFGNFILWFRQPIASLLIIVTLFMALIAVRISIATRFEDLFPATHPNVRLYRDFRRQYGGAQTLILMLRVNDGDIFNFKTLQAIQDITREIDKLPGVNHNEVFSLASYRVLYARALPGALVSSPFMYPKIPQNQAELADLKNNVLVHGEQLAGYVTADLKGALVVASFNELGMDYGSLFDSAQAIVNEHQDANTRIYASGPVMFAAWGYHYLPRIGMILVVSMALMLLILYLAFGRRTGWWAPIVTGITSAIWGLGFVSLMRFNFDPVMLVIPLMLTARDLGHGIQWQGRYCDELDRTADKMEACVRTADSMLGPGILAVLANVLGIVFIAVGDIPVLKQIGYAGAVWTAASLAMVFVFQPILTSYLPRPKTRTRAASNGEQVDSSFFGSLAAIPITRGRVRTLLLAGGALFLIVGVISSRHLLVGYQSVGTPIYRADARINLETAEISKFIPTNIAWVLIESPNYPNPLSNLGTRTLRITDDLAAYLMNKGDAVAVLGFSNLASKPMNMLLHNGHPKYLALPDTDQLSANLWGFFFAASAPDEPYAYFAFSPAMTNSCVRVFLRDHSHARLSRLRHDLDGFVRERLDADPSLSPVKLRYIGGDSGLYLANDDVISRLNRVNLGLVLAGIFLFSAALFRSAVAGALFALSCVMANFVAFTFMNYLKMGLTVDTIPAISLGIGLGIDFGIYAVARIRDEVMDGLSLNDAVTTALRTTGKWVFGSFAVIVGGMIPWVFSPLLFHNEISLLTILLMLTNLIAGLLILPAIIVWLRPRFITRYEDQSINGKAAASTGIT